MKIESIITLSSKFITNIIISYLTLPNNRDFLFESKLLISYNLELEDNIFIYIIDIIISFI